MLNETSIELRLVQKYLKDSDSALVGQEIEPIHLYEKLQLVYPVTEEMFTPRNVALLFFHPKPHEFLKGARTEISVVTHDHRAKEMQVNGPIDQQIKKCLSFILEIPKKESCAAMILYPKRALREAVVNAFHHRSYERCHPDPVKIHIEPEFIDIISYPGPDPSLNEKHFSEDGEIPPVPSRNRRIADFLKSLKLAEGRYTGVGTIFRSMKKNYYPKPLFYFRKSYFCVRLPGHPRYIAHSVRSRADYLCAEGNKAEAVKLITGFLKKNPRMQSETLINKLLDLLGDEKHDAQYDRYRKYIEERRQRRSPLKEELLKWCEADVTDISAGVELVKSLVEEGAGISDLSCVVSKASQLCKKNADEAQNLKALQNAHKLYEAMGEVVQTNASVSFQFADCSFHLYYLNTAIEGSKKGNSTEVRKNLLSLLEKAEDYVETAIQLTLNNDSENLALQHRLLGYIHFQRCSVDKSFEKEYRHCYAEARRCDPTIYINPDFDPESSLSRKRKRVSRKTSD